MKKRQSGSTAAGPAKKREGKGRSRDGLQPDECPYANYHSNQTSPRQAQPSYRTARPGARPRWRGHHRGGHRGLHHRGERCGRNRVSLAEGRDSWAARAQVLPGDRLLAEALAGNLAEHQRGGGVGRGSHQPRRERAPVPNLVANSESDLGRRALRHLICQVVPLRHAVWIIAEAGALFRPPGAGRHT